MKNVKEYNYFEGFVRYADCALEAAEQLDRAIREFDYSSLAEKTTQIHLIEHNADEIGHTTFKRLVKEFLPPIEREDIISLINELDSVVDDIDDVMRRLSMYCIHDLRPETRDFSELLVRCCRELKNLVEEFANFKKSDKMEEHIISINSLEAEGDTLHFGAVSALFSGSTDALQALIWKNVFDGFEDCYDACEHVGDVISGVIMKNS